MKTKDLPKFWVLNDMNENKRKLKELEKQEPHWGKVTGFQEFIEMRRKMVEIAEKTYSELSQEK